MRLDELNALTGMDAERELLRCCGSSRWARMMAAARPFASAETMALTSDVIWSALDGGDWLEAFAAHPRIGDQGRPAPNTGERHGASASSPGVVGWRSGGCEAPPHDKAGDWAAQEQSGVSDASRRRLDELNREYEARFGHNFIVCAAGKSGEEMQAMLERRIRNNPGEELQEAAEQQRQIARLRLVKLLT
jgi:OHCU decarboxylase